MSAAALDAASPDPFVHPALFYAGSREYLAGLIPFIEDGLAAGDPVAVAVPGPNLRVLRAALGSAAEQVRMLDMTEAGANPGRIIPGVLRAFADAQPDRHVRIIGEPIWAGRTEVEYPACAQHEALINYAFTGRHVTILCPYDTAGLDEQVIADARATHPVLIDHMGARPSSDYDPERIIAGYNEPLVAPPSAAEFRIDSVTLAGVREFAHAQACDVGLSDARLGDLALAVTELATNSVKYGGGCGTLRIWADADDLICEVTDAGLLTDPLAGRRPAGPAQSGGRGLLLVHHIVDLVRVHTSSGGLTVRIHLRLPPAPQP